MTIQRDDTVAPPRGPRVVLRPLVGPVKYPVRNPTGGPVRDPGVGPESIRVPRAKRALDLVVGGALTLLAAPVIAVLALLVVSTSRGPAFYRQVRVGQGGRRIVVYKLRTMHVAADAERHRIAGLNDLGAGPLFKMRRDPRVTGVGRWLRKFSLDELPQLFNVLAGSMSLVGPRPALPDEVARYSARERRRLRARPGLTGLWQVSGRSDLDWEESVRLDLRYVEQWSVRLDVWILLRTLPAVLSARGAY